MQLSTINYDTVELKKMEIGDKESLSPDILLHDVNIEIIRDEIFQHMTYQLKAYILGEEFEPVIKTVEYPEGWWQAFKLACYPKWLRKLFPVKMVKETLEVLPSVLYPKLNIALPNDVHTYRIMRKERKEHYWKIPE